EHVSNASPSASKVFWAGGGIVTFPASLRTERSLCKTFQARNRLCFDASNSSSRSWIAFGVIGMGNSVQNNTRFVNRYRGSIVRLRRRSWNPYHSSHSGHRGYFQSVRNRE